ncbi:MAG TPA: ABC transporter permease [Verrucomicrobiota bacterium]|nr:ABC transporter permease [Verrucomicrobiales bacterium]HRI15214.1 ABC transporter permease [Verrucomicrobiota bacterium]
MSPLALALLIAPVLAGLLGTLLPAFGYFPPLGGTTLSFEPWRRVLELPGLWISARTSLVTGLVTTAVSLAVVVAFCAAWQGTRWFRAGERLLAPLLSVPHVAVAFGIAFLLAPSGWVLRLASPWATGFTRPPDWLTVQDPLGLSLMLGLIVKEVPFLLVMTLAALGQADAERSRTVALTLGYGSVTGWLKTVFPRVYPQIRLPVLAVLAYGVSVVDVAIILGPTTPAPLAVRLVRLFNDPDLEMRFVASAGACLQGGLVLLGILIWLGMETVVKRGGIRWAVSGTRNAADGWIRIVALGTLAVCALAVVAGLISMSLWSFASAWRFPAAWPTGLTFSNWSRHFAGFATPLVNTLTVATSATVLAVLLAVGLLEHEARTGRRPWVSSSGMLYFPLVLPQVAFLFGAQILFVAARFDGRWPALTWMHLVFVFPYVFLSLSDAYRAWDDRYQRTAWCLGATTMRTFLQIKLPMLLRAITTATAVGFSVSVGLYLPTLLAGSGHYPTITTEAVTLSAGGDLRLIGVFALLQMVLPFLAFSAASLLPAWRFRQRRGMQVAS